MSSLSVAPRRHPLFLVPTAPEVAAPSLFAEAGRGNALVDLVAAGVLFAGTVLPALVLALAITGAAL